MTFLLELPGVYLSVRILSAEDNGDCRVPCWILIRLFGYDVFTVKSSVTAYAMYLARPIVLWGGK